MGYSPLEGLTMGTRAGGIDGNAVLRLACEMRAGGTPGSIVTLLCDDGSRYVDTYCCDDWVVDRQWDLTPYRRVLERAWDTGVWDES